MKLTHIAAIGWLFLVTMAGTSVAVESLHWLYPFVLCWGVVGWFVVYRRRVLVAPPDPENLIPTISIIELTGLMMAWPLAMRGNR